MDDERFSHVLKDPRFKAIPRKSRKVNIDGRFQSMFTSNRFKVKYKVDRRGRKVNQTSSEDLRKYYELDGSGEEEGKRKEERVIQGPHKTAVLSAIDDDSVRSDGDDDSPASSDAEDSSTDEEIRFSGNEGNATEALQAWREEEDSVAVGDTTSHRLALCNMDWDHLSARDIFVLLNSFKPAGSSIVSVAIYPSDFGLERMAREEIEGPAGLKKEEDRSKNKALESDEGKMYSSEKLRQYQLSRLKYFYAVVECDRRSTAEHIYEQCNGLEYEHCGGQLDIRFVPDDLKFDDREPKSVTKETMVTADYTPAEFINSALQQSKVKLTWDETDPQRLKFTQRKFTKDDLQSMDFSAYLASSSSSEDEGKQVKTQQYKALLGDVEDSNDSDSVNEEMEVTWEHGLKGHAQELAKEREDKKASKESAWEKYLKKKKEKRKAARLARRKKEHQELEEEEEKKEGMAGDGGFDDPFFQHDVTTATVKTTKKNKKKGKKELTEEEAQSKKELELLMMSDEEGENRQHFNLPSILRAEKNSKRKKRKRKREEEEEETQTADAFKVNLNDQRFKAVYESHLFAPDPSAPQYRATKGMQDIMEERRKRVKKSMALKSNDMLN